MLPLPLTLRGGWPALAAAALAAAALAAAALAAGVGRSGTFFGHFVGALDLGTGVGTSPGNLGRVKIGLLKPFQKLSPKLCKVEEGHALTKPKGRSFP